MPELERLLSEAQRELEICNACRYCEGYCAVFPAMERRVDFAQGDIMLLANLCHDCRACFQACMYAPPHDFGVDLPKALADVRSSGHQTYAWPKQLRPLFAHPLITKLSLFALGTAIAAAASPLSGGHLAGSPDGRPGDFYRVISSTMMTGLFLALGLLVVLTIAFGLVRFMRVASTARRPTTWSSLPRAAWRALTLQNLSGGGGGCFHPDPDAPSSGRRAMHILLVGGLGLAFLATVSAAIEQHLFRSLPPYPILSVPVILGVLGGAAIVLGGVSLAWLKSRSVSGSAAVRGSADDYPFIVALEAVALTGIGLLLLRTTDAMSPLLIVHLGCVIALYLTLPYGKFVHATQRLAALVIDAGERAALA